MSKNWTLPLTLHKAAGSNSYKVGGVASAFLRDLDGEAITPDAVRQAIPAFMANRGPDGIRGGPIRLHHDFWTRFLQQAIAALNLPSDQQMDLVAAIALPLGRVTKMWVDEKGTTHWEGKLSEQNPISKIIWRMLQEGLVHLGVSLGGKIYETKRGTDQLGQPCGLITSIRIDELSITDNPALRLCNDEAAGAYIRALSKAIAPVLEKMAQSKQNSLASPYSVIKADPFRPTPEMPVLLTDDDYHRDTPPALGGGDGALPTWQEIANPKQPQLTKAIMAEQFLRKALGSGTATTGMGHDSINPSFARPSGRSKIKLDPGQPATGMGREKPQANRIRPRKSDLPSDVWGLSVGTLAAELKKCADMDKDAISSPKTLDFLNNAAIALTHCTESPPDPLVNLVRFLQYFSRFAAELPHMSQYQANGTIEAMGRDLTKALADFVERMPKELMAKPLRPPGSPAIAKLQVVFPQQYHNY